MALQHYLKSKDECLEIAKQDLKKAKDKFSICMTKHPRTSKLFDKKKALWVSQSENLDEFFASMNLVEQPYEFIFSVDKFYKKHTLQQFLEAFESQQNQFDESQNIPFATCNYC